MPRLPTTTTQSQGGKQEIRNKERKEERKVLVGLGNTELTRSE